MKERPFAPFFNDGTKETHVFGNTYGFDRPPFPRSETLPSQEQGCWG